MTASVRSVKGAEAVRRLTVVEISEAMDALPPEQVEILGLSVLVAVYARLSPSERRRATSYLADRFGGEAT